MRSNPFGCESTVDGKPCGGLASQLYKSALTTRLVCDACAARYKAGGPGGGVTNLMEFALFELIPAREVIVMKLSRELRLNEKMRRLAAMGAEERAMLDRAGMWLVVVYAVGFFIAAWGPLWVLIIVGASYIGAMFGIRRWSSTRWLPKKVDEINKECGYPEREHY